MEKAFYLQDQDKLKQAKLTQKLNSLHSPIKLLNHLQIRFKV